MESIVRRNHKDRLFTLIFGNAEYRENALSLYNALTGNHSTDPEAIQFTTIDSVIWMGMKNDVSILLNMEMSIWEQQSSYNPNMPLRGFLYAGMLYSQYIKTNHLDYHSRKLIKIPFPRYVVLYNGMENRPPIEFLRLSDAFDHIPNTQAICEWTAEVININPGINEDLKKACKPLADYMSLIGKIRENLELMPLDEAVFEAVNYCIQHNIMKNLLLKHKSEVCQMFIEEFDVELFKATMRNEGWEDGHAAGKAEITANNSAAVQRYKKGELSLEELLEFVSTPT